MQQGNDVEQKSDEGAPQEAQADAGARQSDAEGGAKKERRPRKQSAEPADDRARQAFDFLTNLISKMQMECEVILGAVQEEAPNDIHLEIVGADSGRIIGKKGQVLSAIQFLCNRIVNRPGLDRRYVTVDAEGYRSRREDSLATMARRLGTQAMTDGKIITFEPMSPRDRRVVHLALAKLEGVVTRSEGEGDSRRVQIIPVRRQPAQ